MTNVELVPVIVTGASVYYKGEQLEEGSAHKLPESVVKANESSFKPDTAIEAEFKEVKPKKAPKKAKK